jgi:hypothetical protein
MTDESKIFYPAGSHADARKAEKRLQFVSFPCVSTKNKNRNAFTGNGFSKLRKAARFLRRDRYTVGIRYFHHISLPLFSKIALKRYLYIGSCISMAFLMLFGSIGIPLNSMHCARSGRTVVSVAGLPSCGTYAQEETASCSFKDNCCDFTSSLLQIEVNSLSAKVRCTPEFQILSHPVIALPSIASIDFNKTSKQYFQSPPLTGRDILSLNQVFRI